jgi:hypothetical protein
MHEIARPHPIHRVLDRLKWPLAILALLVVPALILQDRATSPAVRSFCNVVSWLIWLAFAAEFCAGLAVARNRKAFVREPGLSSCSSWCLRRFWVPDALQGALGLRALRVLRLVRLVRGGAVAAIGLRRAR